MQILRSHLRPIISESLPGNCYIIIKFWKELILQLTQRPRGMTGCRNWKQWLPGRSSYVVSLICFIFLLEGFFFFFFNLQLSWHALDLGHFLCKISVKIMSVEPLPLCIALCYLPLADMLVSHLQSWRSSAWWAATFQLAVRPSPLSLQASLPLVFISRGQTLVVNVL